MALTEAERVVVDLAERVRAGEASAEEELFQRYRRGIAMILSQRTGSHEDAEDLFQETFRLAFEKIRGGELRDPARLPQFMNSLARNLAIHHYRRQQRRRDGEDLEAVETTFGIMPGQFDRIRRREKAELAVAVLEELRNDRDREILYRFYIAEEDKEEICGGLGLSSLHFNRVLYRAKQRYRELYERIVGSA